MLRNNLFFQICKIRPHLTKCLQKTGGQMPHAMRKRIMLFFCILFCSPFLQHLTAFLYTIICTLAICPNIAFNILLSFYETIFLLSFLRDSTTLLLCHTCLCIRTYPMSLTYSTYEHVLSAMCTVSLDLTVNQGIPISPHRTVHIYSR
jgi:hypothetical protein